MISFGSVPAPSSASTKAASRRVFLSASVPDDKRTSIILLKTEKTLEHVVVGISCFDACFMYGTRDRIFFVSGSACFHRHCEQWHESLPMMRDGRAERQRGQGAVARYSSGLYRGSGSSFIV